MMPAGSSLRLPGRRKAGGRASEGSGAPAPAGGVSWQRGKGPCGRLTPTGPDPSAASSAACQCFPGRPGGGPSAAAFEVAPALAPADSPALRQRDAGRRRVAQEAGRSGRTILRLLRLTCRGGGGGGGGSLDGERTEGRARPTATNRHSARGGGGERLRRETSLSLARAASLGSEGHVASRWRYRPLPASCV